MATHPREELHDMIERLDEDRLDAAYLSLCSLLDEPTGSGDEGDAIFHTLPLTDPFGTSVISCLKIGPFTDDGEARRVADAIVSDIATLYLTSGQDWLTCVHHVVDGDYRHVIHGDLAQGA